MNLLSLLLKAYQEQYEEKYNEPLPSEFALWDDNLANMVVDDFLDATYLTNYLFNFSFIQPYIDSGELVFSHFVVDNEELSTLFFETIISSIDFYFILTDPQLLLDVEKMDENFIYEYRIHELSLTLSKLILQQANLREDTTINTGFVITRHSTGRPVRGNVKVRSLLDQFDDLEMQLRITIWDNVLS